MAIKQETFFVIAYHELEDMIKQVYGKEFSVVADLETSNDCIKEIHVDGKMDNYEAARFNEWANYNKEGFVTNLIMQDLSSKGHLLPGNYLIKISW
jgi:hypothetical protein